MISTIEPVAAIALAVLALFLFTRERIPLETSCLVILTLMVLWIQFYPVTLDGTRIRPRDLFAGFGHEAVVTIGALLVLAKGLETTGAIRPVVAGLARLWSRGRGSAFLATLLAVAIMSMFLNNTPVVAMMLPLLVAVSLRAGFSASRILMPVGFATIIGGMATTIGTSTNLLVTSVAAELGVRRFGMFDFALPVAIVGSAAIVYLWLVAPRLLGERPTPMPDISPRVFEAVLVVNEKGYAAGRSLTEARARTSNRLNVRRLIRDRGIEMARLPSLLLKPGDQLYLRESPERLKEFEALLGGTLQASPEATGPDGFMLGRSAGGQQLAEVLVMPGSELQDKTLGSTRVFQALGLLPVALHSARPARRSPDQPITGVTLRPGDVVLVQGLPRQLQGLKETGRLVVLDGRTDLPRTRKASLAALIMVSVIVTAAVGWVPISISAFAGVALMILTGSIGWNAIKAALDSRLILIIVTSLALGTMIMATGAAELVAELYVRMTDELPVTVALAGFILIIALLTELVTNNAVAVLGTPIAVSIAGQLGAPVEPFVLAVIFGANMSYLTPIGYQTNLMVLSAGGYRFSDFFKVGLPLQLIMWVGVSLVLPVIYDL